MLIKLLSKAIRNVCCDGVETCFLTCTRRIKNAIPAPSDYEPIATICLYSGYHDHPAFNLLVEINEIRGTFLRKSTTIQLETESSSSTATMLPKEPNCILKDLGSRSSLRIKQSDAQLRFTVYKKRLISKTDIASCSINIKKDIIDKKFPRNVSYDLKSKGDTIGNVVLSFYSVDATGSVADSMVYQQALLCLHEYQSQGHKSNINLDNLDLLLDRERLALISLAIEGDLVCKQGYASQMWYFKPQLENDRWYWRYWRSNQDYKDGNSPIDSIPFLAISTVLPHPTDYASFYVKYYTKDGVVELIFKTVGRARDIWTDSLFMFIDLMRNYLERFGNFEYYIPIIQEPLVAFTNAQQEDRDAILSAIRADANDGGNSNMQINKGSEEPTILAAEKPATAREIAVN